MKKLYSHGKLGNTGYLSIKIPVNIDGVLKELKNVTQYKRKNYKPLFHARKILTKIVFLLDGTGIKPESET